MNVKVSIIIPVYNVEPYLRECMDSVVHQTLSDIEILCVDDGSTDGSLAILQEYAARDARVKVLGDGANHGQAHARNVGLAAATGTYVYFMDSDDWVDASALEALVATADAERLDLLFFSLTAFSDDVDEATLQERWDYRRKGTYGKKPVPGAEMFAQFAVNQDQFVNLVGMLLRRSFLSEHGAVLCDTLKAYEDNLFYFETILQAERVMCVPDVYYHRRVRPGSVMTATLSEENAQAYRILYLKLCEFAMCVRIPKACWKAASDFMKDTDVMLGETLRKTGRAGDSLLQDDVPLFEAYMYHRAEKKAAWEREVNAVAAQIAERSDKLVVLYGAGLWARRLAVGLDKRGISSFVFAVTDPQASARFCLGSPVHDILEFTDRTDDCQIIVATGKKHRGAMEAYLRAHGCERFIALSVE